MSRRLLTLSRYGIAKNCTWWLHNTSAEGDEQKDPGSPADVGNHTHAVNEAYVKLGWKAADDTCNNWPLATDDQKVGVWKRFEQFKKWWDEYPSVGSKVMTEVAFAFNPFTGLSRPLIQQYPRDYTNADPNNEVCGTLDLLIARAQHNEIDVIDYKTGRWLVSPQSPQLLGLGTVASYYFEREDQWGNRPEVYTVVGTQHEDSFSTETYRMGPFEPVQVREDLANILKSTPEDSKPVPGPWCNWCPGRFKCPAFSQALAIPQQTALVSSDPGVDTFRLTPHISSDGHAAWTIAALGVVEERVVQIRKALEAYTDAQGGVSLPDGTVYAGSEETKEFVRGTEEAVAAIEDEGLGKSIVRKVSITWKGLKEECGDSKEGREKYDRLRKKLQKMGQTSKVTNKVYKVRKAK